MTVLSVALISFLLLALQIVLMQAVGYAQGHHLAYVILSIALLGFGAGGSLLTLLQRLCRIRLERFYGPALLFCAVSTAWLPFPARALLRGLEVDLLFVDASQWLRLSGLGAIAFLPFFSGAAALSIAFSTRPQRIGRLYGANLLGSAAGAAAVLFILRWSLPEHSVSVLALFAWVASLPARPGRIPLVLSLFAIALFALQAPALPRSPYKDISSALQLPNASRSGPLPHPLGRVEVVQSPALRYAPDLSLEYLGPVPSPPHLFIDGNMSGVLLPKEDSAALILAETPRALPFVAGAVESALFLAPGGTPYLHLAQADNAAMTIVEPHHRIAELIRPLLPARAQVDVSDPRRFLARTNLPTYDLVVFPARGMFGGPTGLQTLGEDSLFTVEAVGRAFRQLAPSGYLAFNVWLDEPLRHALRITDLAVTVLRNGGIQDPAEHIAIVRGWGSMTLLAGPQPFGPESIRRIESFAGGKGFDVLWPSGHTDRHHGSREDLLDDMLAALIGPDPEFLRSSYRFDIRAPSDDRPFFNQFLRLGDRGADLEFLSVSERGLVILQMLLYLLAAAVLLLVLGPLVPLSLSPLRQPFTLIYFTGLGAGFMLFEVALIQRLMPLWGNALTSVALVITALLCGMGIGSGLSRRIVATPLWLAGLTLVIAGITVATLKGLDIAVASLMASPAAVRGGAAMFFLMLAAVPMGIPFPLGVRLLAQRDVRQVPWACGIDGAVAVLAAPGAALLAFQYGYAALTPAVGGAYLLAFSGALLAVVSCREK
ncbi:hypothetical protein [Desulfofustis glycolicus]|uniref:Spermidine synthase n=1 Tax=Desulfofustis glycolicus DSM 9705 TaxID=1121409 RepID=A0A1M5XQ10_9BACT|nr:hypothetical protein [Desulfofustis glycolicus]MCB2217893.1 hypothetical protein [Desulfobulbaceae bacterium]SHI01927.1 hypothetical protein SAMN02745124_03245 [Desulfofustis glycolicus DSM 9705]